MNKPSASLGSRWLALGALACSLACSSVGLDSAGDDYTESNTLSGGGSEAESGNEIESDTAGDESGDTTGTDDAPPEDTCEESCDPWDPNACADGQKCTAISCLEGDYRVQDFACRELTGDDQVGDPCHPEFGGGDSCGMGLFCWQVDDATGIGHCEPFCQGTPDAPVCDAERVCAMFGQAGLSLCVPTCDPLAINCPSENSTCLPVLEAGDFACLPDASEGGGEYGAVCEFSNSCAPGLICVDAMHVPEADCVDGTGCCTEFCELGSQGTCSGQGQECIPFKELPGSANFETPIGICSAGALPSGAEPNG